MNWQPRVPRYQGLVRTSQPASNRFGLGLPSGMQPQQPATRQATTANPSFAVSGQVNPQPAAQPAQRPASPQLGNPAMPQARQSAPQAAAQPTAEMDYMAGVATAGTPEQQQMEVPPGMATTTTTPPPTHDINLFLSDIRSRLGSLTIADLLTARSVFPNDLALHNAIGRALAGFPFDYNPVAQPTPPVIDTTTPNPGPPPVAPPPPVVDPQGNYRRPVMAPQPKVAPAAGGYTPQPAKGPAPSVNRARRGIYTG